MKKITFNDETALARFMAEFITKSTATFEVTANGRGEYVLEFLGGF
jgi:hypothetical protein